MLPLPEPFHSPAPILHQAGDLKIDFILTVQITLQPQTHKIILSGYNNNNYIFRHTIILPERVYFYLSRAIFLVASLLS